MSTETPLFVALAAVLVVLAAVADHAFGWGTGVAVLLTAHNLWRQRRMEARVERQLRRAVAPAPPADPWPSNWPTDWRPAWGSPRQVNPTRRRD